MCVLRYRVLAVAFRIPVVSILKDTSVHDDTLSLSECKIVDGLGIIFPIVLQLIMYCIDIFYLGNSIFKKEKGLSIKSKTNNTTLYLLTQSLFTLNRRTLCGGISK
jgi:hypothetical protein